MLDHFDALRIQRLRLQRGRALPHKRRLAPALMPEHCHALCARAVWQYKRRPAPAPMLDHLDALRIQRVRLQRGRALPHERRLAPALELGAHHREQERRRAHVHHEEAEEHGEAPGPHERRKLAALVEAAELERARARVQRKERRRDLAVRGHRRAEVRVVPAHTHAHTPVTRGAPTQRACRASAQAPQNSRHVVPKLVLLACTRTHAHTRAVVTPRTPVARAGAYTGTGTAKLTPCCAKTRPPRVHTHTRSTHSSHARGTRAGTRARNSRHVVVELVLLALPQQPLLGLDLCEEGNVRAVELVHAPDDQHREPRDEQDRARVPEERVQHLEHFQTLGCAYIRRV